MARGTTRGAGPIGIPDDPLGRVVLVTGKAELLSERAYRAARDKVVAAHPDVELAEAAGHELTPGALGELTAPSLFSPLRCVVVRGLDQVSDDCYDGLLGYAAAPAAEVALVLVHGGGPRGSGLLTKLRKLDAVAEVITAEPKPWELSKFVADEFRRHRAAVDPEVAQQLVDAVGTDLRALAAAADQLAHDFPDERLTAELVGRYFGGRAEGSGFTVADAAFAADRVGALEALRWAVSTGTAPVLVTSAFAGRARDLAAVIDDDPGAARGLPDWKRRRLNDAARGWDDARLSRAVREVARADADVKGAAGDAGYALERLVLAVAALRGPR